MVNPQALTLLKLFPSSLPFTYVGKTLGYKFNYTPRTKNHITLIITKFMVQPLYISCSK